VIVIISGLQIVFNRSKLPIESLHHPLLNINVSSIGRFAETCIVNPRKHERWEGWVCSKGQSMNYVPMCVCG